MSTLTTLLVIALVTASSAKKANIPEDLANVLAQIQELKDIVNSDTAPTVATWQEYLRNITALTGVLVGNESTFDWSSTIKVVEQSLSIIDRLYPMAAMWTQLERPTRLEYASRVFATVDTVAILLNIQMDRSSHSYKPFQKANLRLIAEKFSSSSDIVINFGDSKVTLPNGALGSNTNQQTTASAVSFRDLRQLISPEAGNTHPNVIALKVGDHRGGLQLVTPYKVLIQMYPNNRRLADYRCVFWDSTAHNWNGSGCTFNYNVIYQTVCECDHLTNFGVIDHSSLPPDDGTTKTTTTTTSTVPSTTPTGSTKPTVTTSTTSEPTSQPDDNDPEQIADDIEQVTGQINSTVNATVPQWKASLVKLSKLVAAATTDEVIATVDRPFALRVTRSSLGGFNQLIETPHVWQKLSRPEQRHSSSRIFSSLANLAVLMNAKQSQESLTPPFEYSSLSMQSKLFVDLQPEHKLHFHFDGQLQVEVPFAAFNYSTRGRPHRLAASATLVHNISVYLSSDRLQANSPVLAITAERHRHSISLNRPFKLQFTTQHRFQLMFRDQSQCSFWEPDRHWWSTSGCSLNRQQSNRSISVCECDHLTDFAAIADVANREEPSLAKSILTYVCSALTVFFLLCSLYLALRHNRTHYLLHDDQFKVKANRFAINLNISAWLLVAHLLILFGLDRTEPELAALCTTSSLLLLYALLVSFCFMFTLGVHLYLSTSKRHLFRHLPFRHLALFAYLTPLAIIFLALCLILLLETRSIPQLFSSLTGEFFCWISSSKYPGHIWIFLLPATAIVLVNCSLLVCILRSIIVLNRQRLVRSTERHFLNPYTVAVLLFNFGCPWLLYVLYLNEYMATIFSYLFIVVNGTQGVALFAEQYYIYQANRQKGAARIGNRKESNTRSTKISSVQWENSVRKQSNR